jgi:hypothetical protein
VWRHLRLLPSVVVRISPTTVSVPVAHTSMSARLFEPEVNYPRPGVLLLKEAYGVTEHIEEVGRRLAAEGYTVLVHRSRQKIHRPMVLRAGIPRFQHCHGAGTVNPLNASVH